MKQLIVFAMTVLLWSVPVLEAAEKYALLIGISKYDHSAMNKPEPLQFPEDDAKALGELLKSGGYEVELLLGKAATQVAIRQKLEELKQKADSEGVVLIGLFGHGLEIERLDPTGKIIVRDGCFCPFDTAMQEALDFNGKTTFDERGNPVIELDPKRLIRLAELMRALKLAKAGNRIVLADCCRTVSNAARGRSFGANFSVQDLPENTSILFGCSPNEQAFEHEDWGHGAFTQCLLDTIPELAAAGSADTARLASEMKKRVPALVASISPRDRQTPKPFITDVVDLQLALKLGKSEDPHSEVPKMPGDSKRLPPITENSATKNRGKTGLQLSDLNLIALGELPQGWTTDGVIGVQEHQGRRFVGAAGSDFLVDPEVVRSPSVNVDGDFVLSAEMFAPDGGKLYIGLVGANSEIHRVLLDCGRRRYGDIREWYVSASETQRSPITHSSDLGTISIRRSGNLMHVSINSKQLVSFRAESFGTLKEVEMTIGAAREPAGITRFSVAPVGDAKE